MQVNNFQLVLCLDWYYLGNSAKIPQENANQIGKIQNEYYRGLNVAISI